MAIVDSQLTKVYLVPVGTTVTTAADCATAIASGKELKCIQSLGDIGSTRTVQTYKCLDQAQTQKSLGSFDIGNVAVDFLFDPSDTTGQAELRSIYEAGTRKIAIVKLNDQITPTTGNPTYITFETAMSSEIISIALDNAVIYKTVLEICSLPDRIIAT